MQQKAYKDFSSQFFEKLLVGPGVARCQFELTFKCPLHCRHCYADCYNRPSLTSRELSTEKVFLLLDKIQKAGVLWLCLTGGDPLAHRDFKEIYIYARQKGFIITIFTSGVMVSEKIASLFKHYPPFNIEITVNGIRPDVYEEIAQVKGSFKRAFRGIQLLLDNHLPLKIKTLATRQNMHEIPKIRKFFLGKGLFHEMSFLINPRLDGDLAAIPLRLTPQEIIRVNRECNNIPIGEIDGAKRDAEMNRYLFRCAAGINEFHVDPFGMIFMCNMVRKPLLDIAEVYHALSL
ncbi:MAG: radical SAM protein [Candidatus Omnitrophica bacterium]|nr:radical SAM protein [Candidatus Omnitrophota bacterium]